MSDVVTDRIWKAMLRKQINWVSLACEPGSELDMCNLEGFRSCRRPKEESLRDAEQKGRFELTGSMLSWGSGWISVERGV